MQLFWHGGNGKTSRCPIPPRCSAVSLRRHRHAPEKNPNGMLDDPATGRDPVTTLSSSEAKCRTSQTNLQEECVDNGLPPSIMPAVSADHRSDLQGQGANADSSRAVEATQTPLTPCRIATNSHLQSGI